MVFDGIGDSKLILASMDIHKTIDSQMVRTYDKATFATIMVYRSHTLYGAPLAFDGHLPLDENSGQQQLHTSGIPANDLVARYTKLGKSVARLLTRDSNLFIIFYMLQIQKYESFIKSAPIVVFDANLSVDAMSTILELCRKYNKPGEYKYEYNFY